MKTGGKDFLHPTIFGPKVLDLGFRKAIDQFDDLGDIDKANYKNYFQGIAAEIADSKPDINLQRKLKTYLLELDRRRGTDYVSTFPALASLLKDIET
jgi:hypothetical protein